MEFSSSGSPALAILAGVALSFFAMTGFENTANVAEETIDPHRSFPRSLIGGMVVAGAIYVLVSVSAALTVDTGTLAGSDAALLEVVKTGILPLPTGFMSDLFAVIAMIAITNTTLVAVVTQPRILYGMANEDVVPAAFKKLHPVRRSPWVGLLFSAVVVAALLVVGTVLTEAGSGLDLVARLATVTVLFLLFIYALVIISALRLRGQDEDERAFRANTPLLYLGLLGNARHLLLVGARRPDVAAVVCRTDRCRRCCSGSSSSSSAAGTVPRRWRQPPRLPAMEFLEHLLLVIHIIGFAALLGGLLVQARSPEKTVNSLMRDGIGTAFVAGLLLVGVIESTDEQLDHAKIAVKATVALIILVLVMANLRKPSIPKGLWALLLVLTVGNICVAVFWT